MINSYRYGNLLALGPVSFTGPLVKNEEQKVDAKQSKVACNGKLYPQWVRRIVRLPVPRFSTCPHCVRAVYHLGPVSLTILETHYGNSYTAILLYTVSLCITASGTECRTF